MNRREATKAIVTTVLGIPIALNAGAPDERMGFVDVKRHAEFRKHGIWLRVDLDGQDVTDHCREADDISGYVLLMKQNERGEHYLNQRYELAQERRTGYVRCRRVKPWR